MPRPTSRRKLRNEPPADPIARAEALLADRPLLEIEAAEPVLIVAASTEGEEPAKLPSFTLLAYTGVAMRVAGWPYPVVIDLAGIRLGPSIPALRDHDRARIVGHTQSAEVVNGERLEVVGVVSGTSPDVAEIIGTAGNGFPWQVSVGAVPEQVDFVEKGQSVTVNGRNMKGPLFLAKKTRLAEVSFVALAADDNTHARVAASQARRTTAVASDMTFEEWLQGKGFDPDQLDANQLAFMQAAYDAEMTALATVAQVPAAEATAAVAQVPAAEAAASVPAAPDPNSAVRAEERRRYAQIDAACRGFSDSATQALREQAIAGEITVLELQGRLLASLRDNRPAAPAVHAREAGVNRAVLEAAACLAGMMPERGIVESYGEPAVERAYRLRGLGLQEWMGMCAGLDGVQIGRYQSGPKEWLKAAFSSFSLPGILGNVANKSLLESYNYIEQVWRKFCAIGNVKNFQLHTRYRLTATDMVFAEVGPTGELTHGKIDEDSYPQQAQTYGRMFSLPRTSIINDDLGAFMSIPAMIGRGAAQSINKAVYTLLLGNTGSHFSSGNANYVTGAATALGFTSLGTAIQTFRDQTQSDGTPLGIEPAVLLVPTALEGMAARLFRSELLLEGGGSSSSKVPNANIYQGKFEPAVSAYLSNSTYTGYSALAWYLFADPRVLPSIEVAFLDGIDRPTVERSDADFNTLGIEFRGYQDFGVAFQDPKGAVKMKGEV